KAAATSAAVVKRKKAEYAMRPPPLANELALMQFADGGDMDGNIKRIMESQAKFTGAVALADIYRDAEGGIWWDQDEQWEYAHLLAEGDESRPHATGDLHWITFGGNMSPSTTDVIGEHRRGSMSTQDSDLDPKYVVHPADSLDGDDLTLFGSATVPTRKRTASVLSVPSRPRRAAQHLRKPHLLVDVAFPRPYTSPKSLKFRTSPGVGAKMKLKEKARRRPAPLKLSPPTPGSKQPTNSPIDTEKVRRDFIAASFEPVNSITVTPTTPVDGHARLIGNNRAINVPWPNLGVKKRPSMLNMMGLFRSARKEDVM
ncbi:hypothetical protein L210DRAFT_3340002, partial [Boletus edulis BED1]